MKSARIITTMLVVAAAIVPLTARANTNVVASSLDMDGASLYAAFALAGMASDNFITSNPQTTIYGNGALGPFGTAQSGSDAHFTGFFTADNTSPTTASSVSSTHWVIDGGVKTQSLSAVVADVNSVSTYAASLTPDFSFTSITSARTINPMIRAGVTDLVTVVNIGTVSFTGSSQILTLSGGSNAYFVVNVANQIKLTQGVVAIALSGGLTASHVLFNLTANNSGLNALDISGNATVNGTFVAPNANINLHAGTVNGAVLTGVDLTLVSGSVINGQTFVIPEPSSLALVAIGCLFGLGAWSRRRR
jgi:hypothetical protein